MEFKKIKYSVSNGIASIILNSPKNLNALDAPMLEDLMVALDQCADDSKVKVVVISGEGNSFSAGGDISAMRKAVEGDIMEFFGPGIRNVGIVATKVRNLRKPVIASVKGAAAGAGFNLALVCDFRIAAENTKFIQAFVNIGLVPDTGGIFLLCRMLGVARATELAMLGRPVKASEALSLGLVNKVVPIEKLEEETIKFANKLSYLPSVALANMKSLINRTSFQGFENILDNETEYQIQCANTEDFKEGIKAFAEKRKPNFTGK
ncbi:enoyl-CoA hydratase/isomerase family protein [Crassaminicella profunda]|uniref:enoyl-CoA hydratase/isomerase family protein n=1 Tax=Crassaminicella profunda TaxID=1286698 RepID=UPI001CA6D2A2|nr:enoyl-CoA hydratase [Crassaminicella profunda]QZY54007.1 enoyl-CoA hydratase [Crassaminicella profunda]